MDTNERARQDDEFQMYLRVGNLLHPYKDQLTEEQTERLNKVYLKLGEIVLDRHTGGFR